MVADHVRTRDSALNAAQAYVPGGEGGRADGPRLPPDLLQGSPLLGGIARSHGQGAQRPRRAARQPLVGVDQLQLFQLVEDLERIHVAEGLHDDPPAAEQQ
jgi:hypothetical protein